MIDFWFLNRLQKRWWIPWDLSLFTFLFSVIITWGPQWIDSHTLCSRQESEDPALLFYVCVALIQTNSLNFLAPFSGEYVNWRGWLFSTQVCRKMRHFSFLAIGMDFQPVIFSCQPSTYRMCSQQREITGILGIRAICLIWPWVVESLWCLIKRSSPFLRVSSNSAEADWLY